MPADPLDWRDAVVEMVRGAQPLDGALFHGGPSLTPTEQIGVYHRQYGLRLGDAVREEIVGLLHLLGDDADATIAAYLTARPPTSWTLNRAADALPDWLAAPGATGAQVDMARLDLAVTHAFEATDPLPLDVTTLGADPVLVLQPPVHRLHVSHDVHRVRAAIVTGTDPPPLAPGPHRLVVFRPGLRVRHYTVSAEAMSLLDALATPQPLSQAIDQAVASGADPDVLAAHLGEWFRIFAQGRIVGPPRPQSDAHIG